jgi:hypothetical protein
MQKWEYKCVYINGAGDKLYIDGDVVASGKSVTTLPYLQQLGEQGWEMVAAVSESVSICVGSSAWSKETWGGIRWYFKRQKP